MVHITEWLIGAAVFVAGVVLAGIAMFGMGLTLLWWGFDPRDDSDRPWWLWLLFVAPPVLMLAAGLLVRRAGGSGPVSLGAAGVAGGLVGIAYLVTTSLTNQ